VLSRRADAERDCGGALWPRLLKIAMLSPTSALPRTADPGGDIAGGSTEAQASIDAYLGSAERNGAASGRGVEGLRRTGRASGSCVGASCASWRRSPLAFACSSSLAGHALNSEGSGVLAMGH
jgi:hypothetical protein